MLGSLFSRGAAVAPGKNDDEQETIELLGSTRRAASSLPDGAAASAAVSPTAALNLIPVVKTSLALAAVNFANGVVGAGIIGLPSAMNQAGLPMGIFLCVLVAMISQYTIRLLAEVGTAHGAGNYLELAQRAFGPPGYYVASFFQLVFAFGAMVTYLVLFADTVPAALRDFAPSWQYDKPLLVNRRFVLAIASLVFLLPLCLLRAFGHLAKLGVFKLFATLFLTITVIVYAAQLQEQALSVKSNAWKYWEVHAAVFPALGSISFAFVCHHQTFLVLGSLRNPTPRRFALTTSLAIFGSFCVSLAMGIAGYLTFFERTLGDIFLNYEGFPSVRSSGLLTTARLLLAANMIATYPSEMMVARQTIESVVERRRRHLRWLALQSPVHDVVLLAQLKQQEDEAAAASADHWRYGTPITRAVWEHVGITVGLFAASVGITMAVDDVTAVLNLTGSTAAVFLSFLLPAAIRLRLGASPHDATSMWDWRTNWAPWAVLLFGAVAFVASTGLSLVTAIVGAGPDGSVVDERLLRR